MLIREASTSAELARRVGTNPAYISQLIQRTATRVGELRGVGDKLAERLERAMGKPTGWMDVPHDGSSAMSAATGMPDMAATPDVDQTINVDLLTTIIEAVEEFLLQDNRGMLAGDKAGLIAALYDEYAYNKLMPQKAQLIRFVRKIA